MRIFWRNLIIALLCLIPMGLTANETKEMEENLFMFRPPTLVNLYGHPDYNFLMLKFNLLTDTPETLERVEYHQPLLQHHLMMMLTTDDPMLIASSGGQAYVEERVLTRINEVLMEETGQGGVTGLEFLKFILE